MEIQEQPIKVTLGRRLGEVAHISPLLRKACHLSGCNPTAVGAWLLKCAVLRGASHYRRDFDSNLPPDDSALSNEELGVALCLYHHVYEPTFIRAAAQLLSASDIDAKEVSRLAVMERCELVLLHIADAAERTTQTQQPWAYLREHLEKNRELRSDALPHWSRFVSQTGFTPKGREQHIQWLTRDE